ncbi:hypothetical protein DM860_014854 [Cuscuta australis]|uniref:NmrA-like domain-containing protein n=1 Tax=Cuscuta australis TaxID=267555 RepID=A0A328DI47_9ASTE|nr:hypothetical protein DM860_014854 [Cuscuta australis]
MPHPTHPTRTILFLLLISFLSEFGVDVDRVNAVEPAKSAFAVKSGIRRAVEAEGIPHTLVANFFFSGYFLPNLAQPGSQSPPTDKVVILSDGTAKGKLLLNCHPSLKTRSCGVYYRVA